MPNLRLLISYLLVLLFCSNINLTLAQTDKVIVSEAQPYKEIANTYRIYSNQTVQQYVDSIGQILARATGRTDINFKFIVLDSPEINAFTTSEGSIYITTGMLKYLNSESELTAVLSHEIAHVVSNHIIKQAAVDYGVNRIFNYISKKFQFNPNTYLPQLTQEIITQKFSQSEEAQADTVGTLIMYRAGYDPTGMDTMLENLKKLENSNIFSSFLSSHPLAQARIDNVNNYISSSNLNKQGLITDRPIFHQIQSMI